MMMMMMISKMVLLIMSTVTEHKMPRKHWEKHNTNKKDIKAKVLEEVLGSVLMK